MKEQLLQFRNSCKNIWFITQRYCYTVKRRRIVQKILIFKKKIKISFVVLLHVSSNKLHRKGNQVATYYNANTFKFIIRKYYAYTLIKLKKPDYNAIPSN